MLTAISISGALAVITVLLTYQVLSIVGRLRRRHSLPKQVELLLLIFGSVIAHFVSISLFAAAYASMAQLPSLGSLAGHVTGSFSDFFYFSITCYTTLGFGEIYAVGPLRIVAALEGLNGLVLITWSASFAYALTADLWIRQKD